MLEEFKKFLAVISIVLLLFLRVAPAVAQEAPSAPTAPDAPILEESAPTAPAEPIPPSEPTPPPAPTEEAISNNEETPTDEPDGAIDEEGGLLDDPTATSTTTDSAADGEQTGNQTADGQVGTTTIDTGDATNTAGVATITNTNTSAGVVGSGSGSISVINSDNGSDSENSGSVGIVDNNTTVQDNSAQVSSNLTQTTTTGDNSASQNVGDSQISTGDANTSGTIMTAVNTNIEGIGIAEFSVVDDTVGDLVLNFSAGCIYGCEGNSLTAQNLNNGSDSTNDASVDQTTNNTTIQTNDALIESNLDLSSNSGDNTASQNTNGDSTITTGDANVAGNALTFANNNMDGVYFNFVYIYGDLIGDIILPEEYFNQLPCSSCLSGDILAANTANGSDSTNTASVEQTTSDETYQFNDVEIDNNMYLAATTGDNQTSQNTGGDSSLETGDTNITGQVLNVANSNVSGGDWWLVLINQAGNWIGQILGAPISSGTYAGSDGTQFSVDENGVITAVNSGNGSGSTNETDVSNTTNNTTIQTNTANIVNNLNLSASTGGNSASQNTGGSSSITTGDASIIATIVNMVNNNFTGGRLFVTVIDVFGSWIGDFIAPGYVNEALAENSGNNQDQGVPQGGVSSEDATEGNNEDNSSESGANNESEEQVRSFDSGSQTSLAQDDKLHRDIVRNLSNVQVAGFQTENILGTDSNNPLITQLDSKKAIKINLAWLLIIIPASLIALMAIRKYKILRTK